MKAFTFRKSLVCKTNIISTIVDMLIELCQAYGVCKTNIISTIVDIA